MTESNSAATARAIAIPRDRARTRLDADYALGEAAFARHYQAPRWPLVRLGQVLTLAQYGSSALASRDPRGLPMLRMNNLQDDGWDLTDLKYVDLPESEIENYLLRVGDILVNRTNGSRELVGKSQVFREEGAWVFASYLIRLRVATDRALPEFVSAFLNSDIGHMQVGRWSRQILMSNINASELRSLLVPLPPIDVQRDLVSMLTMAREERDRRLVAVSALGDSLGELVMAVLKLPDPPSEVELAFAVPTSIVKHSRLDATAYRPIHLPVARPPLSTALLGEVASIDSNPVPPGLRDTDNVPYVGLPECDLLGVREVLTRPYEKVKGRSVVRPGDILFARIEPSIFNRKYVFVDDLKGHDYAFTSTEYYVVRAKAGTVLQPYLYASLFASYVFAQVRGRTTGSSGRRRLDRDLFARVRLPLPDMVLQRQIAERADKLRRDAKDLRRVATEDWGRARREFESSLFAVVN